MPLNNRRVERVQQYGRRGSDCPTCQLPPTTTNTAVIEHPSICNTQIVNKVWPYQVKDANGDIEFAANPTKTKHTMVNVPTLAYLLNFTMKVKTTDKPITMNDIIEALPDFYLTDGNRDIIADDMTVKEWLNILYTMFDFIPTPDAPQVQVANEPIIVVNNLDRFKQEQIKVAAGQLIRIMIPIPFGGHFYKNSLSGYAADPTYGFTPHTKALMHFVDRGDTAIFSNRKVNIISIYTRVMPTWERIYRKQETATIAGVGITCWDLPKSGCIEAMIFKPAKVFADGVTDENDVTVKAWEMYQNNKALISVDGMLKMDYMQFIDQTKLIDPHFIPVVFGSFNSCCYPLDCIGLDCTSMLKIEGGIKGGSDLAIRLIMREAAYTGTACCC